MFEQCPPLPTITVIVPTYNEIKTIHHYFPILVQQLQDKAELLVVDGTSTDGSASAALQYAPVIEAPRNRAKQLNIGAEVARSEWLLFLHADTLLPTNWHHAIGSAEIRGLDAGTFHLQIAGRHFLLPLLAWGANWRTRWQRIALGDQGLFIKGACFKALGGFPELPMMEDYAFALQIRRMGIRLHFAQSKVITSGRRWEQQGFWRTWWLYRCCYWNFERCMRSGNWESLTAIYQNQSDRGK